MKLISAFIVFLLSKDGGLVEYTQIMCLNELERMQLNDDFGEAE